MITTSLRAIRRKRPDREMLAKLESYLSANGGRHRDMPIRLSSILLACGLRFALWSLGTVPGHAREKRLFAVGCSELVSGLFPSPRCHLAVETACLHAHGEASDEELSGAWKGAKYAVDRAYHMAFYRRHETDSPEFWNACCAWCAAKSAYWTAHKNPDLAAQCASGHLITMAAISTPENRANQARAERHQRDHHGQLFLRVFGGEAWAS